MKSSLICFLATGALAVAQEPAAPVSPEPSPSSAETQEVAEATPKAPKLPFDEAAALAQKALRELDLGPGIYLRSLILVEPGEGSEPFYEAAFEQVRWQRTLDGERQQPQTMRVIRIGMDGDTELATREMSRRRRVVVPPHDGTGE